MNLIYYLNREKTLKTEVQNAVQDTGISDFVYVCLILLHFTNLDNLSNLFVQISAVVLFLNCSSNIL